MERVAFLIESTGERIACLLNPESLVVRRWTGIRGRRSLAGALRADSLADDPVIFAGGGTTELELELLFDVDVAAAGTAEKVEDVRALTLPLWRLAENVRSSDGETRPEVVRFVWGKAWNVPAVVSAVAERLEAFGQGGAPGRSWMRLKLLRVPDPAPVRQSLEGAPAQGEELIDVHEVVGSGSAPVEGDGGAPPSPAGERLDEIAQRYYGDPSVWRQIAEANDIDDPLRIPSGIALRIPPRGTP
jgi:hypothetical protein